MKFAVNCSQSQCRRHVPFGLWKFSTSLQSLPTFNSTTAFDSFSDFHLHPNTTTKSPEPPPPSPIMGRSNRSTSLPRPSLLTTLSSLQKRIAKKSQLETKSRNDLPQSTTEATTSFHLPRPSIYAQKNKQLESDGGTFSEATNWLTAPDSYGVADGSLSGRRDSFGSEQDSTSEDSSPGLVARRITIKKVPRDSRGSEGTVRVTKKRERPFVRGQRICFTDLDDECKEKIYGKVLVADHIILVCSCP